MAPADLHSHSNPSEVAVTNVVLDLTVDFDDRQLAGSATLTLDNRTGTETLVLDTNGLTIESITLDDGSAPSFGLGPTDAILGRALSITIKPRTRLVTIRYHTGAAASGLHWMTPAQARQSTPFLYSQNEPIDARSWIPVQDSPSVRMTWEATIRVPSGYLALMSAENPVAKSADGIYKFRMRVPIPAYLQSLAVADLEFRALDSRSGVYAAPDRIEAAASELAVLPHMMNEAEAIVGPYIWDRYDVLFMPPSYHVGGMEHPQLTFANPRILSGDGSLVSLIAHEFAHSWTGDLITTATWNDSWLNEGLTVYLERRIMEAVFGRDYEEMLAYNAMQGLRGLVASDPTAPDTQLHLDLAGRDPGEAFSTIPYEKGYAFMRMLEEQLGREAVDEFLRSYVRKYTPGWMDAATFLAFLRLEAVQGRQDVEARLRLDEWVYAPGLPANAPVVTSNRFHSVDGELAKFVSGTAASSLTTSTWSPHEFMYFLRIMPFNSMRNRMTELDAAFSFSATKNLSLLAAWAQWTAALANQSSMAAMERYLNSVGAGSSLVTVYRLLRDNNQRSRALQLYALARPSYHPFTQDAIDSTLGLGAKAPLPRHFIDGKY